MFVCVLYLWPTYLRSLRLCFKMDRALHLSLDFEVSEGVRLLATQLRLREPLLAMHVEGTALVEVTAETVAVVLALRLWMDWGRQRKAWRAAA